MSNNEINTSKIPTHIAYQVRGNGKRFWTRIGAAWSHDKGFNIQLDALPVDGKIVLLIADEKKEVLASNEAA